MKNLIYVLAILAVTILSSCRKEVIYPTDQLPANVPKGTDTANCIGGWGEFLVTDAVMYVDDKTTGKHLVYNHFAVGKDTSSLRWGGPLFDIEEIVRNKTTYSFWKPDSYPGTGKFVLNNDTTKFYCVQYTGNNRSIIEDFNKGQLNMGGSARPFSGQTVDYTNHIITIQIEEMEGVDGNGHAIHYWTQLTLKKIRFW